MTSLLPDSAGNGTADERREGSDTIMASIEDPFVSNSQDGSVCRESHRYSSFDTQLFSLNASSPAQAKRALEAHLAETERRLEEASKLGTALIEQQRELEDKLKEVERQQDEGEIGQDLRRKLVDLEKEYNEIGRETARAFLAPKRAGAAAEDNHLGTPSIDHQKSPISPALFASQATNSPSKVSVPSRKQRNQPSSRVHDIEFATEISTSLLAQVRQLQALLAEREDALKIVNLEKSRLELEAEGYAQRIRALDESEQRYKDENWALETQTHELMASAREAADRETRLNSTLSSVTGEKNSVERELEDLKQVNAKLIEDQVAAQKANDSEIHLLRRNLHSGDAEKAALQQKLEELNSQNEELAKAVAMRLRQHGADSSRDSPDDNDSDRQDQSTPENSPPPSPNKFTPRHGHLETETLRSSLGHAHRMIQNLKSTIHREKTEKIELKRMLQDARDEVEQRRREGNVPGGPGRKRQNTKTEPFRKPPRPDLLGAGRKGVTEVEVHDTDWEDGADASPSRTIAGKSPRHVSGGQSSDEPSDAYHTATEADDAFETANERETATESEAFQTGIESMADDSSDSDQLTETEDSIQRTPRQQRVSPLVMAKARDRNSYHSTASTSASEDDSSDGGFPSPSQIHAPRHRVKNKRSVMRKIRPSGEAPMAYGSRPSSAKNSPATSFEQEAGASEGHSLFAELAELDDTEEDEVDYSASRFDAASRVSTPRMGPEFDSRRPSEVMLDAPIKPAMVDSGVMTDPWEPVAPVSSVNLSGVSTSGAPATPTQTTSSGTDAASETKESPQLVSSGTQWTPLNALSGPNGEELSSVPTPPKMAWDENARELAGEETDSPAPQLPQLDLSSISTQETVPVAARLPELSTSYIVGGATEPVEVEKPAAVLPEMILSSFHMQHTAPVVATLPEPEPVVLPELIVSSVFAENTEPITATLPEPAPVITMVDQGTGPEIEELGVSSILFEHTEPVLAKMPEPTPEPEPVVVAEQVTPEPEIPELGISVVNSESTEPVTPQLPEVPAPMVPECSFSEIRSVETLPVESVPKALIPILQVSDENESREIPETETRDQVVSDTPAVFVAEDSSSEKDANATGDEKEETALPLGAISGNAVRQQSTYTQADQGAQTILSSKQIDQILMDRVSTRPLSPPDSDKAKELGASPFATPKARPRPTPQSSTPSSLPPNHKRPDSATSVVSSVHSHPPLPVDHREAIIAAEKRSIDNRPASPSVMMGPPLAPASAYKSNGPPRPRTPNDQASQTGYVTHAGSSRTTSSRANMRRESQVSRRSSVSSFASEVDERFNMHHHAGPMPQGYAPGTDPRMIQAITQTMIGEFLWKYTRKTGSGDMSNTRHRRYFWVHPYTRTLYWSTQDPQTAGKTELRTKSVPIEAVRVVADDNPYPPGLHCRSLEVVSPGRRVRFTATTSQRHETWFNSLSYLLLRNSEEGEEQDNNVTLEDIDEFNPGFRSGSRQNARMSFSSSQSRTLRNLPKQRAASAMSVRTPGRVSPAMSAEPSLQVPEQSRQVSSSRLSTILNTTIKGSFGRKGRPDHSGSTSLHDPSIHDHASVDNLSHLSHSHTHMDLDDGLENVRACCDGKHDVGALSRTSRYSPRVNRIHSHH